jgi:hypothetical protein
VVRVVLALVLLVVARLGLWGICWGVLRRFGAARRRGGGLGVPGGGGNMGGGGGSLPELVASPPLVVPNAPVVDPNAPVVDPNAPVSMGFLPPNLAMLLPGDVSAMPQTMYTFEDYLAQLNRQGGGVLPPAVQSLAGQPVASVPQGIMSLPPAGLMG